MDFAEILVYVLAAVLAIFLILAVILVFMLIRITRQIKDVTDSAKRAMDTVEKSVENIGTASSAAGVMKLVRNFVKSRKK